MSWWRGPPVGPGVALRLDEIAYDRFKQIMPFVIGGVLIALAISAPAGIPTPGSVVMGNLIVTAIATIVYFAMRHRRFPIRHAHAVGAFVWLLAPINTLSSYEITGQSTLALPLMIELAAASLQVDTRWTLVSTLPVVALGVPLSLRTGGLPVYPVTIVGIWLVALIMQIVLRRTVIRAETSRLDAERAARDAAHELDERRRAEAEGERLRDQFMHAQRMEAIGTLAAGLAHDMNNILGGILAFAEVLHAEATDKAVRADLARIRQEAERGAALTRSLLAFSRRGQYRRRPILLHSVLDDMTPLLSRTLGKSMSIARKDGPPTIIEADPAQLGQVVLNLCMNGADAMNGAGVIEIATDEVELADGAIAGAAPGRYAKLSVRDTGVGMDADTRRRAFEPFFTTKAPGKGTGLGLAMVVGAVEGHGGALEVASEVGKGTTMTIYLPATEASPALPVAGPAPAGRARGLVLVVDDEPVVRDGTVRLVERLGLTAITARDGDEALAVYRERKSDIALVLLDMVMPKLSGPDCYRELRKLGTTPVLLVSGYTEDAAAQALLDAGADGFLEKPYTAEQLGGELDRILGRA